MLIFLCKLWRCCKFSNKNSSEQKGLCLMKLPSKVLNFFLNVIITRTFKGKNKVVRNDKKKLRGSSYSKNMISLDPFHQAQTFLFLKKWNNFIRFFFKQSLQTLNTNVMKCYIYLNYAKMWEFYFYLHVQCSYLLFIFSAKIFGFHSSSTAVCP